VRAAAYARYSTDRQNPNSIDAQLSAIARYCENNDHTIVATFVDMALSGTNTERPEYQRMVGAAKTGAFDCIVVYDMSRGSRDVADWFAFCKNGVAVGEAPPANYPGDDFDEIAGGDDLPF